MRALLKKLLPIYITLLGIVLGAAIYAGAVVAPVTFHSEVWLGADKLSRFEEGVIMTQNFIRLNYFLTIGAVSIILYEALSFKIGFRDFVIFGAAFVATSTSLLFGYYYLPDIVALQQAGEAMTKSEAFALLHKGSEINMKLLAISYPVLLFRRVQRACSV